MRLKKTSHMSALAGTWDTNAEFSFYEFFAGGGMARAGLGESWQCLFANDFDPKKGETYRRNWGDRELLVGDVRQLDSSCLPGRPDLVWGSFPCQDLSLAGNGAGLSGARSGTFWPFFEHVRQLRTEGRGPSLLVLENVFGTLRSHQGKDFQAIANALAKEGFRFGAMIVDASLFIPQSRPRLFVVAVDDHVAVPPELLELGAVDPWHPKALREAWSGLGAQAKRNWLWWNLPSPPSRAAVFADLIEEAPAGIRWHTPAETARLLRMMAPLHLRKVEAAKISRRRCVGTIYKRTREDSHGNRAQRAEVRFDDVAGCLRTPAGGSSRQIILVVEGKSVRSRLVSARETARLMGLPDSYILPENYNDAYHLTGDGVAVPVVRHLSRFLLEPILLRNRTRRTKAA
jgi:DNA (cytosine-5)-methyltransferase 1